MCCLPLWLDGAWTKPWARPRQGREAPDDNARGLGVSLARALRSWSSTRPVARAVATRRFLDRAAFRCGTRRLVLPYARLLRGARGAGHASRWPPAEFVPRWNSEQAAWAGARSARVPRHATDDEQEGVEARVVEALADVPARGDDGPLLGGGFSARCATVPAHGASIRLERAVCDPKSARSRGCLVFASARRSARSRSRSMMGGADQPRVA